MVMTGRQGGQPPCGGPAPVLRAALAVRQPTSGSRFHVEQRHSCHPRQDFQIGKLTSAIQLQWGPLRSLHVSVKDVFDVTADNEKQRFSLKPSAAHPDPNSGAPTTTTVPVEAADASHWLIRANQGHSIPLESQALLRPISLDAAADAADTADAVPVPPVVVHGTYFAFWEAIVASGGLRCMGRNHVHCSTGVPGAIGGGGGQEGGAGASASAVISGMRGDAELLVYLDVRRSLEDGAMSWWVSENGVVLTEGVGEDGLVPAKYFKEVVGRKVDVGVLWKDGELVKELELPEGVQMRAPPGKGPRGGRGGRGGGRGGRGGRGRGRGRGEA